VRVGALIIFPVLLLAVVAGQAVFFQTSQGKFDAPVVAACAVQGEGCHLRSPDGGRQLVLNHSVLRNGCPGGDLHVMRYVSERDAASGPLVASWCS